ncbi:mannose-1-phosphate guanylyltransferase/mannose-6-phosphate isomerase [Pseudomonadota bacterium]
MITPVILSGGAGTRLWPLSRRLYPKQFLNFIGNESLFNKTILRANDKKVFNPPVIICNAEHRFLVAENLQEIEVNAKSIILEPEGRNTAPAIAIASLDVLKTKDKSDDIILVMPSDHLIENKNKFVDYVKKGEELAKQGYFVTFGIVPNKPETGYGYIERDDPIKNGGSKAFKVKRFVEKPNLENAKKFMNSGDFYWNSGIFMFSASKYLEAIKQYENETFLSCKKSYENAVKDLDFTRLEKNSFEKCNDISIDYAVMERSDNIAVVPMDIIWNDIGNWASLSEVEKKDKDGNTKHGDVFLLETKNCYVKSEIGMVATIGVKDLIVVNFKDVVLVANKNNAQDVKKIVEYLKKSGRYEHISHSKVYRPWGNYEEIDFSNGFKVKRITVKPGGKLSLQSHKHRAEHWVVVSGVANVICGDKEIVLKADESTYISKGTKHRLFNKTDKDVELIEVQTGEYLGEDDIIRYEDVYGR